MRKTGFIIGMITIFIGVFGLLGLGTYYILGYGTLVSSPDNGWLQPNTSWSGMMGGGRDQVIDTDLMRNMMTSFAKSTYDSTGEKIYLTAVNEDGNVVTPTTGMGKFSMMSNMMRPIACVNCHGIDGKGGYVFPDGKTASADIRWDALLKEGFDKTMFKNAVTEGIDEKGDRLSVWMPRWDITDKDLGALIAYLKIL